MSAPTRRNLLRVSSVLLAADFIGSGALGGAIAEHAKDIDHPDAALIRMCNQHIVNMNAYNNSPSAAERGCDDDNDPLWDAYEDTRDAISEAEPQTIDGMVAIARAAMAEAAPDMQDADDRMFHGMDEEWAWRLVGHTLRLADAAGRA
jgi:hypothetical protein